MAKGRVVSHGRCQLTGKRSFADEHDAEKALGRAQAKRGRSRAGGNRENRFYECRGCDGYHLTHKSRREFNGARMEAYA